MPNEFEKRLESAEDSVGFESRLAAKELEVSPSATGAIFAGKGLLDTILGAPQNLFRAQQKMSGLDDRSTGDTFNTESLAAGVRSIPGLFDNPPVEIQAIRERFGKEREQFQADIAGLREANPKSAAVGEFFGDIAPLVLLRLPATKGITKLENALQRVKSLKNLPEGAKRWVLRNTVESKKIRSLLRGLFRSGETGVEAAMLDIMQGENPTETAPYAMGLQLAGSAGVEMIKTRPGKFMAIAGATFFAWQALQQTIPGESGSAALGRDAEEVAESFKFAIDKTLLLYAAGIVAGAAGLGRLRTSSSPRKFVADWPKTMDAMNSIPRLAVISMLERLVDTPPEAVPQILEQLEQASTDPALAEQLFGGLQ